MPHFEHCWQATQWIEIKKKTIFVWDTKELTYTMYKFCIKRFKNSFITNLYIYFIEFVLAIFKMVLKMIKPWIFTSLVKLTAERGRKSMNVIKHEHEHISSGGCLKVTAAVRLINRSDDLKSLKSLRISSIPPECLALHLVFIYKIKKVYQCLVSFRKQDKETPEVFTCEIASAVLPCQTWVSLQNAPGQQNQTPSGRTRNRRVLLVRHRLEDELQHCSVFMSVSKLIPNLKTTSSQSP